MDLQELDVVYVPLKQIIQKDVNANQMRPLEYQATVDDINNNGLDAPILVRPDPRGNKDCYEIVDGEHRFQACKDLKVSKVPCIIKDLTDSEAKKLGIRRNNERGSWKPKEYLEWIEEALDGVADSDIEKELETMGLTDENLFELETMSGHQIESMDRLTGQITREEQEFGEKNEQFMKLEFFVSSGQFEIITRALEFACTQIRGMKNIRSNALEMICADYLSDPNNIELSPQLQEGLKKDDVEAKPKKAKKNKDKSRKNRRRAMGA